jgi:hypothetical protein
MAFEYYILRLRDHDFIMNFSKAQDLRMVELIPALDKQRK